ncbi:hypothetical protein FNF27_04178 [Cafeteria roenbergensis]|uniref:Uncharacterized protein n=1 Tax=Cafeteria roenbergensis TaxID=33653 RepID=A0A5A8E9E5_CAFRO|nr:hypothetical protein FNF27_04178 [Cafeteria roenbergensis]
MADTTRPFFPKVIFRGFLSMVAGGTPVSAVEEQMRTGACMSEAQIEAFRWYLEHPEEKGLGIVERMREQSKSKGPAKAAAAADGSRVDVQKLVRMVKGGQLPKRQAMMVLRRKGATHEDFTEFTMAMVGADDATATGPSEGPLRRPLGKADRRGGSPGHKRRGTRRIRVRHGRRPHRHAG